MHRTPAPQQSAVVPGDANRCPFCGVEADVESSAALRQRCRVCGAPRVAVDDPSLARSGREHPFLRQARSAHGRSIAWRVGALLVGAFGLLSLAITALVLALASPGVIASSVALLASFTPVLLAVYALRKGNRAAGSREQALDEAWAIVAADVVAARGREIDARELGRLMRSNEEQAERLLARLNVEDFVRARVTDAGDLVYEPGRARVELDELQSDEALDPGRDRLVRR